MENTITSVPQTMVHSIQIQIGPSAEFARNEKYHRQIRGYTSVNLNFAGGSVGMLVSTARFLKVYIPKQNNKF